MNYNERIYKCIGRFNQNGMRETHFVPVFRALNIDPRDFFYPELSRDNPLIQLLQQLVSGCTDSEADALIPIIRELIQFMRSSGKTHIKEGE